MFLLQHDHQMEANNWFSAIAAVIKRLVSHCTFFCAAWICCGLANRAVVMKSSYWSPSCFTWALCFALPVTFSTNLFNGKPLKSPCSGQIFHPGVQYHKYFHAIESQYSINNSYRLMRERNVFFWSLRCTWLQSLMIQFNRTHLLSNKHSPWVSFDVINAPFLKGTPFQWAPLVWKWQLGHQHRRDWIRCVNDVLSFLIWT